MQKDGGEGEGEPPLLPLALKHVNLMAAAQSWERGALEKRRGGVGLGATARLLRGRGSGPSECQDGRGIASPSRCGGCNVEKAQRTGEACVEAGTEGGTLPLGPSHPLPMSGERGGDGAEGSVAHTVVPPPGTEPPVPWSGPSAPVLLPLRRQRLAAAVVGGTCTCACVLPPSEMPELRRGRFATPPSQRLERVASEGSGLVKHRLVSRHVATGFVGRFIVRGEIGDVRFLVVIDKRQADQFVLHTCCSLLHVRYLAQGRAKLDRYGFLPAACQRAQETIALEED